MQKKNQKKHLQGEAYNQITNIIVNFICQLIIAYINYQGWLDLLPELRCPVSWDKCKGKKEKLFINEKCL